MKKKQLKLKAKMSEYLILRFIQSFVNFRILEPKIQMKRAKRLIHTYLHTFLTHYPRKIQFQYIALSNVKIHFFHKHYFRGVLQKYITCK